MHPTRPIYIYAPVIYTLEDFMNINPAEIPSINDRSGRDDIPYYTCVAHWDEPVPDCDDCWDCPGFSSRAEACDRLAEGLAPCGWHDWGDPDTAELVPAIAGFDFADVCDAYVDVCRWHPFSVEYGIRRGDAWRLIEYLRAQNGIGA